MKKVSKNLLATIFVACAVSLAILTYTWPFPDRISSIEQDFKMLTGENRGGTVFHCYEPDEIFSFATSVSMADIISRTNKRLRLLKILPLKWGLLEPTFEVNDFEYCIDFSITPSIPKSDEKPFISVITHDEKAIPPSSDNNIGS